MDSIKIGDSVRVGPGNEFARVYSFGHYDKNMHAEYVQIRTDVSASPLELTKDHMVFVQDGSFSKSVPASAVNVGDKLVVANGDGVTEVRKIKRVTRRGAFAPFTKTGTIVVSDVASRFQLRVPHGRESSLHAMDGSRLQRSSPHGLRSQLRDLRERNLYQRHLQLGL